MFKKNNRQHPQHLNLKSLIISVINSVIPI
jgi:hypothetical protein